MEINSKEELISFLTELEGRTANLQELVDNMQPAKEEETPGEETPGEEVTEDNDDLGDLFKD